MSLYRKYRPTTFEEVVGQEHVTKTLSNALSQEKLAHAYLFSGPRGTGKTTVARILSKELGCSELDTIEIDAASHRGIDEVRALREQVQFQPTSGEKKIYILDEVHMLTKEAFNALLKMIEEPPEFVHFVLCTTEPHKVPVTIISRTQRFDFKPGTVDSISTLLESVASKEGVSIEQEAIQLIADFANGGYRDSESLLEQVIQSVEEGTISVEDVRNVLGLVDVADVRELTEAILQSDFDKTMGLFQSLEEKQVHWQHLATMLLSNLRTEFIRNSEQSTPKNLQLLHTLTLATRNIKQSPIPQLPIEIAIINWFNNDSDVSEIKIEKKEKPQKATQQSAKKAVHQQKDKDEKKYAKKAEEDNIPQIEQKDGTVHELWPDILETIKPYNHTLEALLKGCEPGQFENNVLALNFKYKFHKEKIEEVQNKQIVEEVLEKVTGEKITIRCVLNGKKKPNGNFHASEVYDENQEEDSSKDSGKSGQKNNGNAGTMTSADPILMAMKDLEGTLIDSE